MGVILPSEYQQVEYLESTGTQYIITNFSPANNIGIRVTIQKTVTEQNIPVFGLANIGESTGGGTYSNYYHITPYNNRWYLGLNGREASAGTYNDPVGAIYQIDFNDQNHDILVNGEIIYSNASFSNPYEKTIAISYRGQTNNHKSGKWKYFGFIIYNNQTSEDLANLIPCYRKSDDEPGMYDLVSGTFFVNQGTGEFTVGPDVIDSISPWLFVRRRLLMQKKKARLPAEYQEVEYIEGSGSQYINSGIIPNANDVYSFKGVFRDISDAALFGCRSSGAYDYGNHMYLNRHLASSTAPNMIALIVNTAQYTEPDFTKNIFFSTESNLPLSIEENNVSIIDHINTSEWNPTRPIYLLGFNHLGSNLTSVAGGKLYYFKINGRCEFIPCYRKSDSEPGMYDLVTNTFFTNAGTGEFIVGANIN